MRKLYKGGCLMMAALTAFGFASCGGRIMNEDELNDGRVPILINVDMGGNGSAWIEEMAKDWNATSTTHRIVVDCTTKVTYDMVGADSLTPNGKYSAWFTPQLTNIDKLASAGQVEDLTDVINRTLPGENRTIWDKVKNKELWDKVGSKIDGTGQYMLPYASSFIGMVFDYEFFMERGYLTYANASELSDINANSVVAVADGQKVKCTVKFGNYEVGEYVMSKGKDGKYGTYDDGQPTTEAEFNELLSEISLHDRTFLYSGQNNYPNAMAHAIMAQYVGMDAYETYLTFDSHGQKVKLFDVDTKQVTEKEITLDNGYDVYKMEGLYKTIELTQEWLMDTDKVHPYTQKNEQPMVIQKDWLNGYRNISGNPQAAFLVEGCWWENEAMGYLNELGARDASRGFGAREYRYMLLPAFEGQATPADRSMFHLQDTGSFVVTQHPKDAAGQAKLAAVKDFIAYTLSDENLRRYTRMTGIVRPYDYEMTAEDLAQMTPFARNVQEIFADTEHIEITNGTMIQSLTPLRMVRVNGSQGVTGGDFPSKIGNISRQWIYSALRFASVPDVFRSMNNYYDPALWAQFVAAARNTGLYDA